MSYRLKRKRKEYVDIIFVFSVFAVAIILYFGLRASLATDTPLVTVASGSMRPVLEVGDLLVIQGVPPSTINTGDIIVFETSDDGRTIHRIIDSFPLLNGTTVYQTKGDANPVEDIFQITAQNIIGKVIFRIPLLGWLTIEPAILLLVITIIIVLAFAWPTNEEKKRRRKRDRRT